MEALEQRGNIAERSAPTTTFASSFATGWATRQDRSYRSTAARARARRSGLSRAPPRRIFLLAHLHARLCPLELDPAHRPPARDVGRTLPLEEREHRAAACRREHHRGGGVPGEAGRDHEQPALQARLAHGTPTFRRGTGRARRTWRRRARARGP